MKMAFLFSSLVLSSLGFAQSFQDYAGDYTVKNLGVSTCNTNARVEVRGSTITLINPDPREDRGWSTTNLTPGLTKRTMGPYREEVIQVTVMKDEVSVETTVKQKGREQSYVKDVYTFRQGKTRTLLISLEVKTRGNVLGFGVTCGYEKK